MSDPIEIFVPGKPVPKSRPRARIVSPVCFVCGADLRGMVQIYTDKRTVEAEEQIAWVARAAMGGAGTAPLRVSLAFYLPRPKSVKRVSPTVRPDIDNLVKTVLDGFVKSKRFDDKMVCELRACKVYAQDGDRVGTAITIDELA